MTAISGIDHIVMRVRDLDESTRWYREVLDFEVRPGIRFPRLRHPGVPFDLIVRPAAAAPAPSSDDGQRLDHLALRVPDLGELERWRARLVDAGRPVEIEHQPGNGSSISLHDPDGLEIELFTPDPDSPVTRPGG